MASWGNVAAHVAAESPELCDALDKLHPLTAAPATLLLVPKEHKPKGNDRR